MKRWFVTLSLATIAIGLGGASALHAQDIFVPPVTTASPGGYANPLKLDTDRYDREQRAHPREREADVSECSADALPAAERREMEREYVRRVRDDGKASADAWVREQGRLFRLRLIADGVCSDPSDGTEIAQSDQADTDESGCRMVMRPVAGLGGAAMTMAMVPDCD